MMRETAARDVVTGPKWDRQYAEEGYIFGTAPNAFLASEAHRFAPRGRILVPGDGEGRNGVWLAEQGFAVTSVDASAVGVEKARALAAARGVRLDIQHANLETWEWPEGVFDGVAAIFVHFEPHVRRTMHRRMLAALRLGGIIVLEAFTPKHVENRKAGSRGGPPPEMLYEPDMLREDVAGAVIELLREDDVTLDEGTRHQGRAHVVRLVARRVT
ncbi:MAG: class I SAM-dependent methyltransferase [Hyphomicrobiaceae bacterium]